MPEYICKQCNFYTINKTKYTRHLSTNKHRSYIKGITMEASLKNNMEYICQYCCKQFTNLKNLNKHIKYYCKLNKDESFQELAYLLNEKNKIIEKNEEKIEDLEKLIKLLTTKLQIKTINFSNNIINNVNFNLLNYNKTNYEHLTDIDYIKCIESCNHCVKTLIEKVHFNKNKPENMNIYISSIKGKFVMVYRDNKWQVKNRKEQIDDLYECNELMLENWYDEYHEKYPHIIQSFKKYLQNKDDDDELITKVKDEILIMLYNKRDLILKNQANTDSLTLENLE
jgi:hypothetical protein